MDTIIELDKNSEIEIGREVFAREEKTSFTYSTVSFARCNAGFSIADLTFNFSITYRSPALTGNYYSSYQLFLYQTISEHREKGMTFNAIAERSNKEEHLTLRGKRFRGAHVHSNPEEEIVKGRVAETRVSRGVVTLQYGSGR